MKKRKSDRFCHKCINWSPFPQNITGSCSNKRNPYSTGITIWNETCDNGFEGNPICCHRPMVCVCDPTEQTIKIYLYCPVCERKVQIFDRR